MCVYSSLDHSPGEYELTPSGKGCFEVGRFFFYFFFFPAWNNSGGFVQVWVCYNRILLVQEQGLDNSHTCNGLEKSPKVQTEDLFGCCVSKDC